MDGIWVWNDWEYGFKLNITNSSGYYVLYQSGGYWDVYERYEDGNWSDYLVFCEGDDITYCTGQWLIYDDFNEVWNYDPDATSLYNGCSYYDCDLDELTVEDGMDCMYSL